MRPERPRPTPKRPRLDPDKDVTILFAEASEITSRAIASAKLTGEQIVSTAKAEADAMREKASREIELERRKTMDELKGEISGLAVEIASKVAEKEIGEKEHEALIGKFIDELGEGS